MDMESIERKPGLEETTKQRLFVSHDREFVSSPGDPYLLSLDATGYRFQRHLRRIPAAAAVICVSKRNRTPLGYTRG